MIVRSYSMSSDKISEDIETGVSGRSLATTFLAAFSCTGLAKELIKRMVTSSGFASKIGHNLSAKMDSSNSRTSVPSVASRPGASTEPKVQALAI